MKRVLILILSAIMAVSLSSCAASSHETEVVPSRAEDMETDEVSAAESTEREPEEQSMTEQYTKETRISEVLSDPVFGDYGRLIFPVDSGYYSGTTLGDLRLTWYNYIDPDKTVEICNYMRDHAVNGDVIFYDIYTEEEKKDDPAKNDTGLFFSVVAPAQSLL